jgi:hypothetical protein
MHLICINQVRSPVQPSLSPHPVAVRSVAAYSLKVIEDPVLTVEDGHLAGMALPMLDDHIDISGVQFHKPR